VGDTTSLVPGFPIRTSSDPRSVDNSPRHIAASHVLHRLPVPRHPPCALKHLQHKTKSLKNFEIAHQTPKSPHHPTGRHEHNRCLDARNHYPQIKHHPPPPKMERQQPHFLVGSRPQHCKVITTPGFPPSGRRGDGLVVSKPNSVSGSPSPENSQRIPFRLNVCRAPEPHPLQVRPIHRIAQITEPPHDVGGPESRGAP
jgi:hypothetical protein